MVFEKKCWKTNNSPTVQSLHAKLVQDSMVKVTKNLAIHTEFSKHLRIPQCKLTTKTHSD